MTRVQHFQQLTQSKVGIPSEYWDVDRKEDHGRAYLNHLDKNSQLFFNALISSIVYAGAFSEEHKFEIIGHSQMDGT